MTMWRKRNVEICCSRYGGENRVNSSITHNVSAFLFREVSVPRNEVANEYFASVIPYNIVYGLRFAARQLFFRFSNSLFWRTANDFVVSPTLRVNIVRRACKIVGPGAFHVILRI